MTTVSAPASKRKVSVWAAATLMGLDVCAIAIAFLANLFFARNLSADDYGTLSFLLATSGLIVIPVALGLPNLVMRETARLAGCHDPGEIKGLLIFSMVTVAIFSIAATATAPLLKLTPSLSSNPNAQYLILMSYLLIPTMGIMSLTQAAAIGTKNAAAGKLFEGIVRPIIVISVGSIWLATNYQIAALTAITAHFVGFLIATIGLGVVVIRSIPVNERNARPTFHIRTWIEVTIPFLLSGGAYYINTRADVLMLGIMDTTENVGIYNVSSRTAVLLAIATACTARLLAPTIVDLHAKRNYHSLERTLKKGAVISTCISTPIAILFWTYGSDVIQMVYGSQFKGSSTPLTVLCVAHMACATLGHGAIALNMTGHQSKVAISVVIAAAVNISLNYALIPRMGPAGAATATATSMIASAIIVYGATVRTLRINASIAPLVIARSRA